jgi:glycine oxidase
MAEHADVLIVGAGVIGLATAWRCRQRGLSVTVVDPAPGSGASTTAAGMLAPVTELHYGEQSLLNLNLESAARYPAFVTELTEFTGLGTGYRASGTVSVAWDGADLAGLRDLAAFGAELGQRCELLSGRELKQLVPALASGLPGGLLAPNDHQIDNRLLHRALRAAVELSGVRLVTDRVVGLGVEAEVVRGVALSRGDRLAAGKVVLAAGAWSGQLAGLPDRAMPVRPIKGQTLRLTVADADADAAGLDLAFPTVRGTVKGNPVYVVSRGQGELVIGASSEEAGFDLRPRAGAVYELLRDSQSLLPMISEAQLDEVSTSVRPGTPDNAPLIGPTVLDGLIAATGHYRNGILLTPVTADTVAALIAGDVIDPVIAAFDPSRFSRTPAGAR